MRRSGLTWMPSLQFVGRMSSSCVCFHCLSDPQLLFCGMRNQAAIKHPISLMQLPALQRLLLCAGVVLVSAMIYEPLLGDIADLLAVKFASHTDDNEKDALAYPARTVSKTEGGTDASCGTKNSTKRSHKIPMHVSCSSKHFVINHVSQRTCACLCSHDQTRNCSPLLMHREQETAGVSGLLPRGD